MLNDFTIMYKKTIFENICRKIPSVSLYLLFFLLLYLYYFTGYFTAPLLPYLASCLQGFCQNSLPAFTCSYLLYISADRNWNRYSKEETSFTAIKRCEYSKWPVYTRLLKIKHPSLRNSCFYFYFLFPYVSYS